MDNDFTRLDKEKQGQFTAAILQATAMSEASTRQPESVLTQRLRAHGIGPEFAKLASQAFNKRRTIDFMAGTPEDRRGGTFPIVDPQQVFDKMTGADVQKQISKQAYVFRITAQGSAQSGTMLKIAGAATGSCSPRAMMPLARTQDIPVQDALHRLQNVIDKVAVVTRQKQNQLRDIQTAVWQGAEHICNSMNIRKNARNIFQGIIASYDQDVLQELRPHLPQDADMTKNASYMPSDLPQGFRRGMDAFSQLVRAKKEIAQSMQSYCSVMLPIVKTASQVHQYILDKMLDGTISKLAASQALPISPAKLLLTTTALPMILGPASAGLSYAEGVLDTGSAVAPGILQQLSNSQVKSSPSAYIDTEFLTAQRKLNHAMALSDMLADKDLSKYDAGDVADAFTKTLQADSSLQRPDRRQLLRGLMRTRMVQNNKLSVADVAALGQTIRGLQSTLGSSVRRAKQSVDMLPTIQAPQSTLSLPISEIISKGLGSDKLRSVMSTNLKQALDAQLMASQSERTLKSRLADIQATKAQREQLARNQKEEAREAAQAAKQQARQQKQEAKQQARQQKQEAKQQKREAAQTAKQQKREAAQTAKQQKLEAAQALEALQKNVRSAVDKAYGKNTNGKPPRAKLLGKLLANNQKGAREIISQLRYTNQAEVAAAIDFIRDMYGQALAQDTVRRYGSSK